MFISQPQLTLEAARAMSSAAFAEAERLQCTIVVAVLDAGGQVLLIERGQGAPIASIEVARRKAESAAFFGMPTAVLEKAAATSPAVAQLPHALPFGGGMPVRIGEQIAGAIGVSGGLLDQDLACAEAALAVLDLPA